MKIQLLRKWMGHPRRAVLDLSDRAAQDLIARRTAKPYKIPFTGATLNVLDRKKLGKKDVDKVNKGLE